MIHTWSWFWSASTINQEHYPIVYPRSIGCSLLYYCCRFCHAYMMIYRSRYCWFNSPDIKTAALVAVSGAIFYIYREITLKRLFVDLSVFKYPKFWEGILLGVKYYGINEKINLILGYIANVMLWSPTQRM